MSRGNVALKMSLSRVSKSHRTWKTIPPVPDMGRGGGPGGVFDHGAREEDGPGTWEALASLEKEPVPRRPGDHSPTRPTFAARTSNRPNQRVPRRTSARPRVKSVRGTTGAGWMEARESKGRIRARKVGNARQSGATGAKAARAGESFRREPWPVHRRRGPCHRNF